MSELSSRNIKRLQNKDEVLSSVTEEIRKSEVSLGPWKNKLVKFYELYKMVQSKKHYSGLANIFVPEVLRAVETIAGNLYRATVGHTPWFEYKGREKFDEPSASALTQLTRYQMDENSFNANLMDSFRQMAITGLTVRKVLWDFKQIRVKRKVAEVKERIDSAGQLQRSRSVGSKNVVDTVRDVWTFEPVDLLNFHVSDITTPYNDIQKAKWIGEQFLVERQWIKERIRKGWLAKDQFSLLDLDKEESKDQSGPGFRSAAANLIDQRNRISGYNQDSSDKNKIEIIERWGLVKASWVHTQDELNDLELDSEDLVEGIVIIANRKAILKLEANPFWHGRKPYLSAPYIPQEGELPGIGVAQIAESLQEELNDTRNQVMDNKTLILANMWLKSRGSGIRNKDLRIRPMGVISTNDMKGLTPLRPPVLSGVGVNIEGIIKNDLRESVGAPSNLQGIAQSGVGTATEAGILNREGFARLSAVAELYGLLVIKPLLVMTEFLNYQFYDRIKAIKVVGERGVKFRQLEPEEIVGNKDVVISLTTDSEDSPSVKRQQLIQFFTTIQQFPPELIQFHWGILNKLYKQFFPHGDLSDIYEPPVNAVDLLNAEEELDLVLGDVPVLAKQGQDHKRILEQLEKDFEAMKFALSEGQFKGLQNLIESHQALLEEEMELAIAQKEEQLLAAQGGNGQKGGKRPGQGNGLSLGQRPDTTPFTARSATTPGQIVRNSRAGA